MVGWGANPNTETCVHDDVGVCTPTYIVIIAASRNYFAARAFNAATAGSSLPSRNSRNAPPPVEM